MLKVGSRGCSGAVVCGLIALVAVGIVEAAEYPGSIPGGFSVGNQGEGSYTIPIAAPAATGGLKPNLALTYNHLAGNGLAGMRWTLSGFSSITRCQQNYAQDGLTMGLTYGNDYDRFCLDGQRLVPISGNNGASGTEYRTEIDSFARIKSIGTYNYAPEYFTVERGDGTIAVYGSTSDSRIDRPYGGGRIWYIAYVEDQFSNRMSFSYSENTTTGEAVPVSVAWTSNASQGLSARYSVTINYETRPSSDQRSGYDSGGGIWAMTKRITSIEVKYDGYTEIARYTLGYASSTASGRSQLETVTLSRTTGSVTDTLPETTFTWQGATAGWGSAYDTDRSAGSYPLIGDFNNDGRQDIFVSLSGTWQVYLGNADGSLSAAIDSGISYSGNAASRVIDYDGDGDSDLLYPSGTDWMVLNSEGDEFAASATSTGISSTYGAQIQDIDGDGLDDWLFVTYSGSGSFYWFRNTGAGFDGPMSQLAYNVTEYDGIPHAPVADFDDDRLSDFQYFSFDCYYYCGFHLYAYSSQSGTPEPYPLVTYEGSLEADEYFAKVTDLNGDGHSDLLYAYPSNGNYAVALSLVAGSFNVPYGHTGISGAQHANDLVIDYNRDGRDDLLLYNGSGTYYVHLSTGTTISSSYTATVSAGPAIPADITGDGYPDLVYISGGEWQVLPSLSGLADVVTTFENGLGHSTTVTYQYTSQTTGDRYRTYPDSGVTLPSGPYIQEFNGPRVVVTDVDFDDGIGGEHNLEYVYASAMVDRSGRGWLSFAWSAEFDSRGTFTITDFMEDWPYAGAVSGQWWLRMSDSQTIREAVTTWDKTTNTSPTPNIHFIRVESTTSKEYEVGGTDDGDLIRTVVDNPTYNTTYGFVEERTVTTTDPTNSYTWTTYTDYNPNADTDDWCLGLPGQIVTTNTKPDSNYATRSLTHYFNSGDCSLAYTIDDSDWDTAKQLKTTFTYDGYGNPDVISTDSVDTYGQNRSVDYDYDSWGQFVTSETVGTVNLTTSRTWDYVNGQPASITGTDGLSVAYAYDSFGRLAYEDTPGVDTAFGYIACVCLTGYDVYYRYAWPSAGIAYHEYLGSPLISRTPMKEARMAEEVFDGDEKKILSGVQARSSRADRGSRGHDPEGGRGARDQSAVIEPLA